MGVFVMTNAEAEKKEICEVRMRYNLGCRPCKFYLDCFPTAEKRKRTTKKFVAASQGGKE